MIWLLRVVTFIGLWVLILSGRFGGPSYQWQMCIGAAFLCAIMLEQLERYGLHPPESTAMNLRVLHHFSQLNAYVCVAMAITLTLQHTLFHAFFGLGISLVILNVVLMLSESELPEDDE